ncbi:MAG: hypothetical protein LKI27_06870 [Actinomyces sp.]|nr:hypothetical protein [Actinomyces sp.]MCI1662600.1 hypothetical protein [Actinomyces sp.]
MLIFIRLATPPVSTAASPSRSSSRRASQPVASAERTEHTALTISAIRDEGDPARRTITSPMNATASHEPTGHSGTRNSDSARPPRWISERILTCDQRTIRQTRTVTKVANDATTTKTPSGTAAFKIAPTPRAPHMTADAAHGTPRFETFANAAGACPPSASPNNMRPAPDVSALIAGMAATMTTMLRIEAAGTPRAVKICAKGLASPVIVCHGTSDMMIASVTTSNSRMRAGTALIARGDGALRIVGLARCDTDHLDAPEREHDDGQRGHQTTEFFGRGSLPSPR